MVKATYKIQKIDSIFKPSVEELKQFAMQFSKRDWQDLTWSQRFLNIVMEDLDAAGKLAEELLCRKIKK